MKLNIDIENKINRHMDGRVFVDAYDARKRDVKNFV